MQNNVISLALKAGECVLVHAKGSPAQVVAVGVAAAAVVAAVTIGYGTYNMGENWLNGGQMANEISAKEFRKWLKDKRITLDCGHHACLHNFLNTIVVMPEGKIICSECFQ